MFTGLIQALGRVQDIERRGKDCRMRIESHEFDISSASIGDSICINGVCLTAYDLCSHSFWADVSGETLSCTTLGQWQTGQAVNLEAALQPTSRLGGHIVSGHVDGIGTLTATKEDGKSTRMTFGAPPNVARYIAVKGSICIDGISLTVNHIDADQFDVNIIPHTLTHTTMPSYAMGQKVNLEVDIIARYLERLLQGDAARQDHSAASALTPEFLSGNGYLDRK